MKIVYGKGDEILWRASANFEANPGTTFGPLFIGVVLDFFFAGVTCNQVQSYFRMFPRDSRWIKQLVTVATILSLLKLVQTFSIIWEKNIIGFGDWMHAADTPWNIWFEPTAAVILALPAQIFFLWRCFELTNRNWWLLGSLLCILASVISLSAAAAVRFRYDPFWSPGIRVLVYPMLSGSVIVDVVITSIVTWKLAHSRTGFSTDTDHLLTRLMALTWESAVPPALAAVANLILYITMGDINTWHGTFNILTPRLYIFSLMHTLNSRATYRMAGFSQDYSNERPDETTRRANTYALSSYRKDKKSLPPNQTGTLPVHVHTETITYNSNGEVRNASMTLDNQNTVAVNYGRSSNVNQRDDDESLASFEKDPK